MEPTPRLGLARPDDGDTDWGDDYRNAMMVIDAQSGLYIRADAPVVPGPYLWIQTGLGGGDDIAFWVETG